LKLDTHPVGGAYYFGISTKLLTWLIVLAVLFDALVEINKVLPAVLILVLIGEAGIKGSGL
jgi:hypothetical protein